MICIMKRIGINNNIQGHLLAVFCALVWGTTFVSSKVLLRSLTPVELLFDRFLLGYAALWLMQPKRHPLKSIKEEVLYASAGLSGVCLYYLFENMALTYTQAANVSVIVSTAPLFVSIFAHFFLKDEKLHATFFIGFLCAAVGIILLSFGGGDSVAFSPVGDLFCVAAAVLWGIYSVIVKKINAYGYSVVLTTRRIFFYGVIFMIPAAIAFGYELKPSALLSPVNLANILFLGIIACSVCFVCWNKAVLLIGAVQTSAYIYAIPVITLVASVLILKEKVTVMMIAGVVLTIAGLVISEKKTQDPIGDVRVSESTANHISSKPNVKGEPN